MQCNTIKHNKIRYNAIQKGTMKQITIQEVQKRAQSRPWGQGGQGSME